MTVYALALENVSDPAEIRKLMRPQVLARSRAADNYAARYQRAWFEIKRIGRSKRYVLMVEVKAEDIEQAEERAGMLLRRTVRHDQTWEYNGAWGGYSLALIGRKK